MANRRTFPGQTRDVHYFLAMASESRQQQYSSLGRHSKTQRQFNVAMSWVTFPDGGFRQSNQVLHGVPFCVIPNQQVSLRAVRALDRAFVVRVDLAIV
jgi:hypothetical protein